MALGRILRMVRSGRGRSIYVGPLLLLRDLPVGLRETSMLGAAATDAGVITCATFELVLSIITCCVSTSVMAVTVWP